MLLPKVSVRPSSAPLQPIRHVKERITMTVKSNNGTPRLAMSKRLVELGRYARNIASAAGCLIAMVLLTMTLRAQTTGLATLSGRVTDASGAVVQNAAVKVTNTATGVALATKTNGTGFYQVSALIPGPYKVTVSASSFKVLVQDGVTVDADSSTTLDMKLAVGSTDQEIVVTAEASLLNTTTGNDGQLISTQQIQDLPTPGENVLQLLKFSSAIQSANPSNYYMQGSYNAGSANSQIGVFGFAAANQFMLDGAPDESGGHQVSYAPPNDEVAQMFTNTTGFDAQVGKTLGAYINITSKTGTSQFHGSIRDTYEDLGWQALTFFARLNIKTACAQGPSTQCTTSQQLNGNPHRPENNGGATIGGPIVIPGVPWARRKLFFFFGTAYNAFTTGGLSSAYVPTLQERGLNGTAADFSDLPGCPSACGAYTIYDPLTVKTASSTNYVRQAFAGNVIPSSRINNPLAKIYNAIFPLANNGGVTGLNGQGNYLFQSATVTRFHAYTPRIDFALSERDRFFGRASKIHWLGDYLGYASNNAGEQVTNQDAIILSFGWTHVFSPNLVMENTFGYSRYYNGLTMPYMLAHSPSSIGLPAYMDAQDQTAGYVGLPQVLFGGTNANTYAGTQQYSTVARPSFAPAYDKSANFRDGITYVHGKHSAHFGGEWRLQTANSTPKGNINGSMNFDNTYVRQYSNGSGSPQQYGLSYASFLLGIQTSATQDTQIFWKRSDPYYSAYAQDDWRVNSRWTVNIGLRYEYEAGPVESSNRQLMYFDPTIQLPFGADVNTAYATGYSKAVAAVPSGLPAPPTTLNTAGGTVYASSGSRKAWNDMWRVLPRFGTSFALRPDLVLRGGFGLFYDSANALNQSPDLTGFSSTTTANPTNDSGVGLPGDWVSGNPYAGIAPVTDPFPTIATTGNHYIQPLGNSLGSMAEIGNSWNYYAHDYLPARQRRWAGTVQKQFGSSTLLQVDYLGAYTDRVTVNKPTNSVPAAYFTGGNVLNPNTNALNGTISGFNPFSYKNMADMQQNYPVVYNNVLAQRSIFTSSNINVYRLLEPYPAYGGVYPYAPVGAAKYQAVLVSLRRRFSHGASFAFNFQRNWDMDKDVFLNSYDSDPSWELSNNSRPTRITAVGTYQLPFGKSQKYFSHGFMSKVFGGYQTSWTLDKQDGALLSFGNLIFTGTSYSQVKIDHPTTAKWFNTQYFDTTSADQLGSYNSRVFPTRIGGVRQQGYAIVSGNIQRSFPIEEWARLDLRFQCSDIFNNSLLGGPNVSPTSAQFGQVTGNGSGFDRFINLSAKISF